MNYAWVGLEVNRASLTVKKEIHFDAIQGVDAELEKIKGKLKFCACLEPDVRKDTVVVEGNPASK